MQSNLSIPFSHPTHTEKSNTNTLNTLNGPKKPQASKNRPPKLNIDPLENYMVSYDSSEDYSEEEENTDPNEQGLDSEFEIEDSVIEKYYLNQVEEYLNENKNFTK